MQAGTKPPFRSRRKIAFAIAASLAAVALVFYLFFSKAIGESLQRRKLRQLNVILITLDTMRADHLGCYSRKYLETPALDELAAGGVVFENCIAQTPLTLPSHTTILSGTYPLYHQVRDNGGFVVPPQLHLISEILQEKKFRTAAFIASYVLHSKWGINQGFDHYDDRFDLSKYKRIAMGEVRRNAADVLAQAEAWLGENAGSRFFAWVHLYDPHAPYDPPAPYRERYAGHPYRAAVAYMDGELGKFFDFLKARGLFERSLIIVTGDHGESLGEHKEINHGFFLYKACVQVPLIIHAPFAFPAKRVSRIVEHVDLVPTILDSLKIETADQFHGRSLLPLLFGKNAEGFDHAYTETYYPRLHFGWSELKAYYSGNLKYILAPQEELYDWQNDAGEARNLLLKNSFARAKLKAKLSALVSQYSSHALQPINFKDSDRESLEKLHSLGYITATVDTAGSERLLDPKAKVDIYLDFSRAHELSDGGDVEQAIALVQRIIAADPEIIDAYMFLGNLLYNKKDFPRALANFQEALRKKPDYNFAALNVINSLNNMGDWPLALKETERFLVMFPNDPMLHYEKGNILFQQKKYDAALDELLKAIALDRSYTTAMNKAGEIYFAKGDYVQADSFFRQALHVNPDSEFARFNLALIAEEKGDVRTAIDDYQRILAVNPDHMRSAYNLAELLRKTDRYAEAIPYYQRAMSVNPHFNIPYFMVAKYELDRKQDLPEAIRLCRTGVAIAPPDKYTAFGYYILSDIYAYLRQPDQSQACLAKADAIMKKAK